MPFCSCCGFKERHGVYIGRLYPKRPGCPLGWTKEFHCIRCFTNPRLFMGPARRDPFAHHKRIRLLAKKYPAREGLHRAKYGHAAIKVSRHKPAGVWKGTWYSVDTSCHGCWHDCGSGHPTDNPDELDMILARNRNRILGCKDWNRRPRVRVLDLR